MYFRCAFGIWNSTVACCDSRSFWKLKCNFLKEIMYLLVCQRDLTFNGGLMRFKVILEIEMWFYEGNCVSFGMPTGSEIQRWLVAIQGHSGNQIRIFFSKLCMFWYALRIWNSTVACFDSRTIWKLQCDFMKEIMYLPVCYRDLKFNGGLLRFKVILEIEMWFYEGNYVYVDMAVEFRIPLAYRKIHNFLHKIRFRFPEWP